MAGEAPDDGRRNQASLTAFMDEYRALTWPSPLEGRDRFWSYQDADTKAKLPLVITELAPSDGYIRLGHIISPERQGEGQASFVLKKIVALADKHGVTITLSAKPFGRVENKLNKAKLMAWYKRYGWSARRGADMIRFPR